MTEKTFLPEDLICFLKEANLYGYASGKGETSPSRTASRDLKFAKGDWLFLDSYFGSREFIGNEIIYFKDKPVWGMNYYGWSPKEIKDTEKVFAFLRQVLLMDMPDILPVRGPKQVEQGAFRYENSIDGTIGRFFGGEKITWLGRVAHVCHYHGGFIS